MTNLVPTSSFDPVPQLETTTIALAGPSGPMNTQAQALLNRTQFLYDTLQTGLLPILTSIAQSLPTVPPSTPGVLWNNGGVISLS